MLQGLPPPEKLPIKGDETFPVEASVVIPVRNRVRTVGDAVKSALTQTSIVIPIAQGALALGTWQGLYLFEHRHAPHARKIVLHVIGA